MSIKGLEGDGTFVNSKVVSRNIMSRAATKGMTSLDSVGHNHSKVNVGLSANSKAAINPTTDSDDGNPRAKGLSEMYGLSNKGGASGDGATPGFSGSGAGIAELNGAHSNDAKRNLNYGN